MINVAVEGESDREMACALIRHAGQVPGTVRVARGKSRLDPKIAKYRQAARSVSWLVLRDSDGACPVELVQRLDPAHGEASRRFAVRVVHGMTEAWLMGDREGFGAFFSVSPAVVPADPENLHHAKQTLLAVCAKSSSRHIREGMVARHGKEGPLYVALVNEFASQSWDVGVAAERAPSLARAIRAVRDLL